MHIFITLGTFCKRLFWATTVAYMVAWHNVYKEEDKILHQVVITMEEDKEDENSSPDPTILLHIERQADA